MAATQFNPDQWEKDSRLHKEYFKNDGSRSSSSLTVAKQRNVYPEEIRTTPIFTAQVLKDAIINGPQGAATNSSEVLPEYALLARLLEMEPGENEQTSSEKTAEPDDEGLVDQKEFHDSPKIEDDRLFVNINAPWSAFICGSQGSGKSYTLSCILESSLKKSQLGPLRAPLAGLVFHFDTLGSSKSRQICEAAYLASEGIPVTVMVSPYSFDKMEKAYTNLPSFPANKKKPKVVPMFLWEKHLNVERMMKLMASDGEAKSALYMETVMKVLRSIALCNQGMEGLNYQEFRDRIAMETFNPAQLSMLSMRLSLLESVLHFPTMLQIASTKRQNEKTEDFTMRQKQEEDDRRRIHALGSKTDWNFNPGGLMIVDLSCPFIDKDLACDLYNVIMDVFLDERQKGGRIIALDEAHKFLTGSLSGNAFTESLLSVIRQQRHLATRVIIATQEPTIAPSLLDLCSVTLVHRFSSPTWMKTLESHLAGMSWQDEGSKRDLTAIFRHIVKLNAGQALLFSPTAVLGVSRSSRGHNAEAKRLGVGYLKVQVRKRQTTDGGRSILAT